VVSWREWKRVGETKDGEKKRREKDRSLAPEIAEVRQEVQGLNLWFRFEY